MRRRRTKSQDAYDAENSEAAEIIRANPARYGGALAQWAELWHKKNATVQVAKSDRSVSNEPQRLNQKGTREQQQLFPS